LTLRISSFATTSLSLPERYAFATVREAACDNQSNINSQSRMASSLVPDRPQIGPPDPVNFDGLKINHKLAARKIKHKATGHDLL